MNIATVLTNLKKGNHDTFKEVVYHYSGMLMTVAKIYTRNSADAEDVLQDSFISIYRNIHQFKGNEERAFVGWMKKIVTNAAISKYKKFHYSNEKHTLESTSPQTESPSVLKQYEYEELMAAIYDLPLNYRQIVGLYAISGYAHKEIAEMLNIAPSSSRSMYSRAISKLQTAMSTPLKKVKNA